MFECDTKITKECQKEILRTSIIYSLVLIIIGAVGLLACSVYNVIKNSDDLTWILLFVFLLSFGIALKFLGNKAMKNAETMHVSNHYTFQEDFFVVDSSKNGEVIGASKIYYKEMFMVRHTKNYILLYANRNSAFPVELKELGEANKSMLLGILTSKNVRIANK